MITLPPSHGKERDDVILQAVAAGQSRISWAHIVSTHEDHEGHFWVFADALKLLVEGPNDFPLDVRINVSASVQQQIADILGCSLLTPKLADLMWAQAHLRLTPSPQSITSSTEGMLAHSQRVDDLVETRKPGPWEGELLCPVGKHWCLDQVLASKTGKALNYGWHFEGASYQGIKGEVCASLLKGYDGQYVKVIQGRGTAHDASHVDYSQVCVLASTDCRVDGKALKLADVLTDPALAPLISHQGALTILRQPGVPEETNRAGYVRLFDHEQVKSPLLGV